MYFLTGADREYVCEQNSNLFDWKRVRRYPNFAQDLAKRMSTYRVLSAKNDEFKAYQTLNYVHSLFSSLNVEEVENYHPAFMKILRWLTIAVTARKDDIVRRKARKQKANEDRVTRITLAEEREANRLVYLADQEDRFRDERRDDFEAYETYTEAQKAKEEMEYGEEEDDEDLQENQVQEPPVMPIFDRQFAEE